MEEYMNCSLTAHERAKLLLKELTLDEKIAQLMGIFADRIEEKDLADLLKHGIGQVSTLAFRMCKSSEEAACWQRKIQKTVMESSRLHIPAAFHMEGLCGAFIQGATAFPTGVSRGSSFDPELERQIGEIVSRQEAAYGITQILAPVLDISRDSRMGRQCEPYGEDPTLSAAMGVAFTKGIQETETAGRKPESTAKHFLGFHNSLGGIHGANCEASERLLYEIYGKPFQAAISKGCLRGVMPCYDSLNGLPVHASKHYLTDTLRDEMGFQGVVMSDYSGAENAYRVQMIGESEAECGYRCLKAGLDIELPMPSLYRAMQKLFQSGEADLFYLDQAVLRVLESKFRMGLFEYPYALTGSRLQSIAVRKNDDVARRSAEESIVLIKNHGILPLKGECKVIAVIGPQAVNARYYFGGYTHLSMVEAEYAAMNSMAGTGEGGDSSKADMNRIPGTNVQDDETEEFDEVLQKLEPDCKNLVEELQEQLPEAKILWARGYYKAGEDRSGFDEALDLVRKADVTILTLGGKNGSGSIATMGEGVDGTNINLPNGQEQFICEAAKLGKPLIGVHFDGRPISSDAADRYLDAVIEAWNPATYAAEAVTDVLLGKVNPSGKLPLTVARNAGQIPIYYNHPNGSSWHQGPSIGFTNYVDAPHRPRYAFGHGLSYTDFAYSKLEIDQEEVGPDDQVIVSCFVENVGNMTGTEVVQLYLRDLHASMTRPVMELQGFARVSLGMGEKKKVQFCLYPSQMAFLDEDMKWKIEKGEIQVLLGSASDDIRLKGSFYISEDRWIVGRNRGFYADVTVEEN